jgi:hypothetical protein
MVKVPYLLDNLGMGERARGIALERFYIERISARQEELYERVLRESQVGQ